MQTTLSKYVKAMRKQHRLTQVELSEKSGVGLRFVRELEQGAEVGVVPMTKTNDR